MSLRTLVMRLEERIASLDRLTDAKFTTLRTVVESQEEKTRLALDASKAAIDKAEMATSKAIDQTAADVKARFESVNEFRQQQRDMINGFMPRAEFDQFRAQYAEQHALLRNGFAKDIADLKGRLDRAEGRSGGFTGAWAVIVAVAGIAIAIGALVFRNM